MIYDGDRIYPSFFSKELKDVCSPVLVSNRAVSFWVYESKLKHSDIAYFDHISYLPIKAIMQFTGLKDKNGKEIYDSDILKIQYFRIIGGENLGVSEVDAELVGVVEITPLALVLKNIIGEKWCEYTGYEQGEGECRVFHLHDVYEGSSDAEYQIEVIGNIYENPELLK